MISKRKERVAQVEPEIDGLFQGVTIFWEMLRGTQGLLKARDRLAVG
jgi:hypothetical protein